MLVYQFWTIKLAFLRVRCVYGQCSNCFGRLAMSRRLSDPGSFSRSTGDLSLGPDKGGAVPPNKPLEISMSLNEMENEGSTLCQQTWLSSSSSGTIPETQASVGSSDANSLRKSCIEVVDREKVRVGGNSREASSSRTQRTSDQEMVDFLVDVWEQEGLYE